MTARGWDFSWRRLFDGVQITMIERGGSDWREGAFRAVRRPGSVSIVAPGQIAVGTHVHGPSDFFQIELDVAPWDLARVGSAQWDRPDVTEQVRRLADRVRDDGDPLEIESLLEELLAVVRPREPALGRPERQADVARRMRDVLHARHAEPITLAMLAREARVSRFHGLRTFRAAYGVTPFEYLMHLRLERARAALLEPKRPADAAAAAGFSDQAHFTRWFKRVLGTTPGAFARQYRTSADSNLEQDRRDASERGSQA